MYVAVTRLMSLVGVMLRAYVAMYSSAVAFPYAMLLRCAYRCVKFPFVKELLHPCLITYLILALLISPFDHLF